MKFYDKNGKPNHFKSQQTRINEAVEKAKLDRKAKELAEGVQVTHDEGVTLIDDETKTVVYGPGDKKSAFTTYLVAGYTEGELTLLASMNLMELFVAGKAIQEMFVDHFNMLDPEAQEKFKEDVEKIIEVQGGTDER